MSAFYSLKKILAKNAIYNLIIGERSNGKTYAVLKYAVQEYFKTGGQLAIVRRWKEDVIGRRARDIFSALISNNEIEKISKGQFTGVCYYAGKFYFCNYDEKGKALYNDCDDFAFCFALSENEHNKSISYPKITTIFFDEFLTRGLYLPDEFVLFMNTLSTIIRQRQDVKIFMCANTVNKYAPYFREMGLAHITAMEQGSIDVYTYGESKLTVAVEYCSNSKSKKKNNFYFAFDNPRLEMIKTGKWELDIYPHLPEKYLPKNILFIFFIEFEDEIFQCEVICTKHPFLYIHKKSTPIKNDTDLVYSLDDTPKMNYNKSILKPTSRLGNKILWFFVNHKVFYQDNSVGDSVHNYLTCCKRL